MTKGGIVRVEELVGARIKEARERAGMTQPQLGEWLGPLLGKPLPRQAIHAAEQGKRQFTAAELLSFAHVLGCSVTDLFAMPLGVESLEMPSGQTLTRAELDQVEGVRSVGKVRAALTELAAAAEAFKNQGFQVEQMTKLLHDEIDRALSEQEGEGHSK